MCLRTVSTSSVWISPRLPDLAADGKRIVALMPLETPEARQTLNQVAFVQNFFDELQRRAPIRR